MSNGSTVLTTSGFYGSKNKRKWIGLEKGISTTVKKHQAEKIPKPFCSRILGPPTKWQIFHRQQDAFRFAKGRSKDLHVFAFESNSFKRNTGQRLYLVASYPVFWHYFRQLDSDKCHHYEVIPEGAVCKLYFDLEFDRTMNPDSCGEEMVKTFVQYVCSCLESIFNVKCTYKDFLDLDASTSTKFSRHLIWQVKKAAFKDNIHAGRFVCCIMSYLYEKLRRVDLEVDKEAIDVLQKHQTCIPDGQNLHDDVEAGCKDEQKTGSERGFVEKTDSCETESAEIAEVTIDIAEAHFQENDKKLNENKPRTVSVVDKETVKKIDEVIGTITKETLEKLIVKNKNGDSVFFCDLGVYTKNRNFRLFLSSKLHKNNPLVLADQNMHKRYTETGDVDLKNIFLDSLVANVVYSSEMRILSFDLEYISDGLVLVRRKRGKGSSQDRELECLDGYNKSPYPEVDEYINGLITEKGGKGVIRHWTYFHQGELLVYEIVNYRYCHNIGRHHRSNNIMLIVDLQKGVLYQKCHDPDCHMQNYKSPEWPLPGTVLPASYFDLDEDLEFEEDDVDLLNSAMEVEKQYLENSVEQSSISELEDGADEELLAAASQIDTSLTEHG